METVEQLAEQAVRDGRLPGAFDYALPIDWCDDVKARTGVWPRFFVWHYPPRGEPGYISGKPFPLTEEASNLLQQWEEATSKGG